MWKPLPEVTQSSGQSWGSSICSWSFPTPCPAWTVMYVRMCGPHVRVWVLCLWQCLLSRVSPLLPTLVYRECICLPASVWALRPWSACVGMAW